MDEEAFGRGLSHLFATVFLHCFATFMVAPAMIDVSMAAICPGKDECSLAIYLTGAHQVIIGLGSIVVMPLVGILSDSHGRKSMLTIPMALSVLPLAILAYNRTKYYYYAYFALRTLIAMATEGSVQFLALAYVADNVSESKRAGVFGMMSGIASSSFVLGNFSSRFLSTASTFQVAAVMSVVALVYMRLFLPDSNPNPRDESNTRLLSKNATRNFKVLHLLQDSISLLRTSRTFAKAAAVAFFINVSENGFSSSAFYFLKAEFHFNKDQFADLMMIVGVAGSFSQLVLLPILTPIAGEKRMLSIGLFFTSLHMILYSVAWAPWVAYASASMSVLATFAAPCLRSVASKQMGSDEQGKGQGCITGISSLANILSPLAFTPLTALFLSDRAPFHFPGFTLLCAAVAAMIAFAQSTRLTSTSGGDQHLGV
ncbi:hypothetical protein M569_01349 [Genlisea aurea]|uniref:Major facilitator superfamily (MFS) profile domain-containing protein n=1 Tax=Genlisea aurea TaxID=192259 RepID=S8D0Y6_9LAMI|nr:hypothetical protein M569_01349 [Genlisea aurea]